MYIWRKRVGPLARHENLARRFGTALAVIERPGTNFVLLEVCCRTRKGGQQLIREFGGSVEKLHAGWLEHFAKQAQTKPIRIGSRLIVQGSPGQKQRDRAVRTIVIPAEAAFGTGQHATTAMCLRVLERQTRKLPHGWSMLDAGTGSGILAIAGSYLGAGEVLAIDSDPLACSIAKRNARANGACNIEFKTGDVLKLKLSGKFDVITANLYSEILIMTLPAWSRHLGSGACLILSGILRSQEKAIVTALRRNHCAAQEIRRRGKWIAVLAFRRTARKAVPT